MKIKEILKKVLNYNWRDKEKDTLQKKAIRIMAYFLISMIIFTFLSRFANSLTIPRVSTSSVNSDTISTNVRFDGVISESKENSMAIAENLKVSLVNVSEGDNVKKDDVLLEVDLDSINENIRTIEKEIYSKEKAVIRAQEDYHIALKNEESTIASALSDVNEAKSALDNISDEDIESKTMLENDYKEKKLVYENAKKSKDTNLLTYKRAIEDAEEESDTKDLKENLDKLNQLLASEGKLKSSEDTKVSKVLVAAGDVTTTAPVISLVDNSAGYKVKGLISKDYEKYVTVGKKVSASLSNGKNIEDLEVNSVSPSAEDVSMLEVTVNLPKKFGEIGNTVSCDVIGSEKKYETCIPLESLREEGNNKFVLITSEEDTILGKELKAKKVVVEVKAKSNSLVAVDGLYISPGEELIVSSNKNIKDGDKVRLENR